MEKKYIALLVAIVIGVFLFTGNRFAEQKIIIGECSASFNQDPVTVRSELCSANETCVAQPEDQQANAIVDALTCACGKAKAQDYGDATLSQRIEEVVRTYYGYSVSAEQLCEQPGLVLAKRSYG